MKYGHRIKTLRKKYHWSQAKLAQECGWEDGTMRISNYEKEKREPTIQDILKIAGAFKASPAWLVFGVGEDPTRSSTMKQGYIPVLEWDQVAGWVRTEGDKNGLNNITSIPSPDPEHPERNLFALRIKNDAMINQDKVFTKDTIIIIDPQSNFSEIKNGEYIVAIRQNEKEAILRQYIVDGDKKYLKPLNHQFPIENFETGFYLCGLVIQTRNDHLKDSP